MKASVSSAGNESIKENNFVTDTIDVVEFSELEVYGKSSRTHLNMNDLSLFDKHNLSQAMQITNTGPSKLKALNLIVKFPTAYFCLEGQKWLKILENITIAASYEGVELPVIEFKKVEDTTTESPMIEEDPYYKYSKKRKREAIDEPETSSIVDHLPEKKSLILTCRDFSEQIECTEYLFEVKNVQVSGNPIAFVINFAIHPESLQAMALEEKDLLLVETSTYIQKPGDEGDLEIKVSVQQMPYFIIFKSFDTFLSIWFILGAVLAGLLLLAVISYLLFKFGFFRRNKKEELERLTKGVS